MVQDLQDAEPDQVVVPVVEMKVLELESELLEFEPELRCTKPSDKWKDHEVDTSVSDVLVKGMTEKTRLLLFGGAMIGVSMIVYGVSKFIHYINGK